MVPVHRLVYAVALAVLLPAAAVAADGTRDALWAAVRNADAQKVRAALDAGPTSTPRT
jgi:hypothetical protein